MATDRNTRLIDVTLGDLLDQLTHMLTGATVTPQEYRTVLQAAELLHCTERHVRRLIARGRLKARKISVGRGSSRVLIPSAEIDAMLSEVGK